MIIKSIKIAWNQVHGSSSRNLMIIKITRNQVYKPSSKKFKIIEDGRESSPWLFIQEPYDHRGSPGIKSMNPGRNLVIIKITRNQVHDSLSRNHMICIKDGLESSPFDSSSRNLMIIEDGQESSLCPFIQVKTS